MSFFTPWITIRNLKEQVRGQHALVDAKNKHIDHVQALAIERGAEIKELRAMLARFDHDGDGKPGGSKSKKVGV